VGKGGQGKKMIEAKSTQSWRKGVECQDALHTTPRDMSVSCPGNDDDDEWLAGAGSLSTLHPGSIGVNEAKWAPFI